MSGIIPPLSLILFHSMLFPFNAHQQAWIKQHVYILQFIYFALIFSLFWQCK